LIQSGWDVVADYFCKGDIKYRMVESKVPRVVKPQTDTTEATPSPTTFEEFIKTLNIIPGKLHMPQVVLATVPTR
jgi:hypothetical protein